MPDTRIEELAEGVLDGKFTFPSPFGGYTTEIHFEGIPCTFGGGGEPGHNLILKRGSQSPQD